MEQNNSIDSKADTPAEVTVLVVDDHPIVRHGICQLIAQAPEMKVCGEAGNSREAMEVAHKLEPDVAIVDLSLGTGSGLDLIKQMAYMSPKTHILVISMHDEKLYAERAMRAGAQGYIMKDQATESLIGAIRTVNKGEFYLSSAMATQMLRKSTGKFMPEPQTAQLSNREMQVLEMMGDGLNATEIGGKLGLSPKTIETHKLHIRTKMGLSSASELRKFAVRWLHDR